MVAGRKARHRLAQPAHIAIGGKRKIAVAGGMQPRCTRLELERKRLLRRAERCTRIGAFRPCGQA